MEINQLVDYFNNPESLNEETLEVLQKLTGEFPYSQSLWMLYLKNLKIVGHPEFKNILQANAVRITDRKKLYYLLNSGQRKHTGNIPGLNLGEGFAKMDDFFSTESDIYSTQFKGSDLIDNFIASKPSVRIKNSGENNTQTDFSENSVVENDEIITETFAELLVQQKKYGKAIQSFEKLSLRFPEKSIYFAGRIEEIRKLKDN
jgi:hypothetical protein